MEVKIAVVPGDGIGVDVTLESLKVLNKVGKIYGHTFRYESLLVGGCSVDKYDEPITEETLKKIGDCDAILFGAAGGPKWDSLPRQKRPEKGLGVMRQEFDLYANVRPVKMFPILKELSSLKDSVIEKGIDMVIIRDLTGGIYYHEKGRREGKLGEEGFDTEVYSIYEVERVVRKAFGSAMQRKKQLVSVDKANALESSQVWRETVSKVGNEYPEVKLVNMLVDKAAMDIATRPYLFDVVVSTCLFGDILSDIAGGVTGAFGILPSASINSKGFGLFEPIHGTAPDIAGKGIANPIASILSSALMLETGFGLKEEAEAIRYSVEKVLEKDYRTSDIFREGKIIVNTSEMGNLIVENIN